MDVTQDAGAFGASGNSNIFAGKIRGMNNTVVVDQTLTAAGMNSVTLNMLSNNGTADVMQNGVGNVTIATQGN